MDLMAADDHWGPGRTAMLPDSVVPSPAYYSCPFLKSDRWASEFHQGVPCSPVALAGAFSYGVLASVPCQSYPHTSPCFSWFLCLFGRKETVPAGPRTVSPVSRVPVGQCLSGALPALQRRCWLENWNLNAIVFDFVTFPLGRLSPPSCSLACVPTLPCHRCYPSTLQPGEC